ncbi:hypothetical protein V6N13_134982 [Hibiscus sabdariffa]|uniref:Uncharacterized protein n=1 Tax=Hibiscus sabdariffa TaxID=183260 RepID=A0ABR2R5S6_9ROSI
MTGRLATERDGLRHLVNRTRKYYTSHARSVYADVRRDCTWEAWQDAPLALSSRNQIHTHFFPFFFFPYYTSNNIQSGWWLRGPDGPILANPDP